MPQSITEMFKKLEQTAGKYNDNFILRPGYLPTVLDWSSYVTLAHFFSWNEIIVEVHFGLHELKRSIC